MTNDFYKLPWYKTIDWTPVLVFSLGIIAYGHIEAPLSFENFWYVFSMAMLAAYPLSKLIEDEKSDSE